MSVFEFLKLLFASKLFIFLVCLVLLVIVAIIRAIYNDYFENR